MNPVIEQMYAWLPTWAQNFAISAYGLGYRKHRLGGDFRAYVEGFRAREEYSPEQMYAYVQLCLRETLVHAFRESPYYRDVWFRQGLTERDLAELTLADLRRLPILTKDELRRDPERFVAEDVRRSARLHRNQSSGSTGTPITAIWTDAARRRMIAAREVRSFGWAGASVFGSRAMIGGRIVCPGADAQPPYYRYNYPERQVYFSAYHLRPAAAASYVEGFNRYRPKLLTGYAHCYYFLAKMMLEQGRKLEYQPEAIVLSSEKLDDAMKQAVEKAFGRRPFEEYGSVENCVLVTECEQGRLHLNVDFGWLEIVDNEGRPTAAGKAGRLLCTGFVNDAQPLIRYEIGDVGAFSTEPCPCGRDHLPTMMPIEGRIENIVVGPDGRQMVRFHSLYLGLPHVIEGQVVQERLDRIKVRVVVSGDFGEEESNAIRDRVLSRLGNVQVSVEPVASIERNRRGKFPAVVSLLSAEERRRARFATV